VSVLPPHQTWPIGLRRLTSASPAAATSVGSMSTSVKEWSRADSPEPSGRTRPARTQAGDKLATVPAADGACVRAVLALQEAAGVDVLGARSEC
jgi:hypothetical protein